MTDAGADGAGAEDASDGGPEIPDAGSELCEGRTVCKEHGKCTLVDGECRAVTSEDCSGDLCKVWGRCEPGPGGYCTATGEEPCADACEYAAHCDKQVVQLFERARYVRCRATRTSDCPGSTRCEESGHCILVAIPELPNRFMEIETEFRCATREELLEEEGEMDNASIVIPDRWPNLHEILRSRDRVREQPDGGRE